MIPDPQFKRHDEIIAYAKRIGTYGKDDRSKQYELQRYSSATLLKNDNLAFQKIRKLESDRFWHAVLIIGFYAVIGNARVIVQFIESLF